MIPEKWKVKSSGSFIYEWLYSIVSPLQIELEAPHNLETCAILLKRLEHTGFDLMSVPQIEVDIIRDGENTYNFYVKQWGRNALIIKAVGYFRRFDDRKTAAVATVNITSSGYGFIITEFLAVTLFVGLGILTHYLPILHTCMIGILGVSVVSASWYVGRRHTYELCKMIEVSLLGKTKT